MSAQIIRDLGDGLVLRRTTPADAEALAAYNAEIHREPEQTEPDAGIAAWTRDLLARPHPTFDPGDFTVVVDTRTDGIVSSLNLINQKWSYGGVEFGVGRPELVGTLPGYRGKGLVRTQFEVIHAWSAERGHRLQAITGIAYFYRQFGYEMALALGGGRAGSPTDVPKLKEGESEPYRVRPATEADLPFLAQVDAHGAKRSLVSCVRDEAQWRYELAGRSPENGGRREVRVVETADGEPVGLLTHPPRLFGSSFALTSYELKPGVSWLAATPSVARYLRATGEEYAERDKKDPFAWLGFWLGAEHPAYQAMRSKLPRVGHPYAWYVRVPDLPGFLQTIAPVLERRLAESSAVGHTGDLRLSFYRDGVRLPFERGRLMGVEPWKPTQDDRSAARFPGLTFLQLLFGYRSLEDLEHAFADCRVPTDETRVLVTALFPKQASSVWGVD